MKFDQDELRFKDVDGDEMHVFVEHGNDAEFLLIGLNFEQSVVMTREEARKFAKAIRKEVRKVPL